MTIAIQIDELSKSFQVRQRPPGRMGWLRGLWQSTSRDVIAVDRISLRIAAGERVAFVGPNGAGKSTTIKMCSGILFPSTGSVRVAGLEPWQQRQQLAYRIGTVFGQRSQLWQHLPASDTFDLLAAIYDIRQSEYRSRRKALVEAFEIGDELTRPVRQLSLGQRMRCEIVASLLHAPEVLFLDEPTIGLDVCARATIRDLVRSHAERDGRTVLLTSHDTADMERVCDRVIVIHGGRILVDQPLEELRRGYIRRKRITLHTAEAELALVIPGVRELSRGPHRLELEVDLDRTGVEAVIQAAMRCARLTDLTVEDPGMDEVVQAIYASAEPEPRERAS